MRHRLIRTVVLVALLGVNAFAEQAAPAGPTASLPDGRDMSMPTIEKREAPAVPAGTVGDVDIETIVGTDGRVVNARVVKSPDPSGALGRACIEALKTWRFRPSISARRAVAALVIVRLSFGPVMNASVLMVDYALPLAEYSPRPGEPEAVTPSPSRGVTWPAVLREVKPRYTRDAMRAKIQGQVEMEVVVAIDGTVGAARVTRSLDSTYGLDTAALVAARYWLFKPATMGGAPVPAKVGLILEFRLH